MPQSLPVGVSRATAVVILAGGADNVYVRVNGWEAGPITKGETDAITAVRVAAAINASPALSTLVNASPRDAIILLSASAVGVEGNALTLDAEATVAGQALASGGLFTGGVSVAFLT